MKFIQANYEASDLNIAEEEKIMLWNEVNVRDKLFAFIRYSETDFIFGFN